MTRGSRRSKLGTGHIIDAQAAGRRRSIGAEGGRRNQAGSTHEEFRRGLRRVGRRHGTRGRSGSTDRNRLSSRLQDCTSQEGGRASRQHAKSRVRGANVGQVAKTLRQLIERDGRKDRTKSGISKRVESTRAKRIYGGVNRPARHDMIAQLTTAGGRRQYRRSSIRGCTGERQLPTGSAGNQKRNRSRWEG